MNAKDLRNTKIFGKMDPQIVIEHRNVKYKTEADEDGHTEPIWNEKIDVPIYSFDEELKVECKDIGIMFDEIICSTFLKITYIKQNQNSEFSIPMYHNNKVAGNLKLYCFISLKNKNASPRPMINQLKSILNNQLN